MCCQSLMVKTSLLVFRTLLRPITSQLIFLILCDRFCKCDSSDSVRTFSVEKYTNWQRFLSFSINLVCNAKMPYSISYSMQPIFCKYACKYTNS